MTEGSRSYELDTDGLMAELERTLSERGYEVTEQMPAGIWWVKTDREPPEAREEIGNLVRHLVMEQLRPLE